MAINASKVSSGPVVTDGTNVSRFTGSASSFAMSPQHKLQLTSQGIELRQSSPGRLLKASSSISGEGLWGICRKPFSFISRGSSLLCRSRKTHNTEAKECVTTYGDCEDVTSAQIGDEEDEHQTIPERTTHANLGLAEACKYVYNDAKFVNERARNDIFLLSRGIMRLDARARQDLAILESQFLKLNARAREDTKKIDRDVKKRAEHLHHIATILTDKAQSRLKRAADKHWSDGALEADLRLADFSAKQRAMEDALMALELIKNIHDMMVSKMYKFPLRRSKGSLSSGNNMMGRIMLEKNGKTLDFFPGEVSTDRIAAIQEAYWSMASVLSEADGIDYTDPEELELLIATLIDLDAMDGKSSVSLLAECSSSPDVNTRSAAWPCAATFAALGTIFLSSHYDNHNGCKVAVLRKAVANALAAAPSMWTLGNAGMGALQRLAEDSNPAIAIAASKAIYELKKQWEINEGDSWRFMMNQETMEEVDSQRADDDTDTH